MASRSVNKVILVGHLGRDAETKFTPGGAAVTRFSVATNRRWKDKDSGEWKEETDWSNVVLWRSENLANYLTKGKQIYVEGRLQTRSYEDKDGKKVYATEVVADDVILLGGQGGGGAVAAAMSIRSSRCHSPAAHPRGLQLRWPLSRTIISARALLTTTSPSSTAGTRPQPRSSAPPSSQSAPQPDDQLGQGITDDDIPFWQRRYTRLQPRPSQEPGTPAVASFAAGSSGSSSVS